MRKLTNQELRTEVEKRSINAHSRGNLIASASQQSSQAVRQDSGVRTREIYLVLDNLRSVYNIGAIFRTADAVGVNKIYLCGICAQPPRPDLHKTALGCENYVDWEYHKSTVDIINDLKRLDVKIVALEQTDESHDYHTLQGFNPRNKELAMIVGNEVDGISQEVLDLCDLAVDIPMVGWANSLNVTTALGVVLFSLVD